MSIYQEKLKCHLNFQCLFIVHSSVPYQYMCVFVPVHEFCQERSGTFQVKGKESRPPNPLLIILKRKNSGQQSYFFFTPLIVSLQVIL